MMQMPPILMNSSYLPAHSQYHENDKKALTQCSDPEAAGELQPLLDVSCHVLLCRNMSLSGGSTALSLVLPAFVL